MADQDQDQDQDQDARPSIDDYGRTLTAGYSHDEIRQSIENDSGLTGDDLNAEYAKLQAATTVHAAPGEIPQQPQGDTGDIPKAPDPIPGSYNPEQEQTALRSVQNIANPERRLRVESYIKQEFANLRIMDGVTQAAREKVIKTAVGQYSKAIEEIRDDPRSSLQQKQNIIRQLTQTMWNDPRVQYGETQGQLESYMQKLAFGEDAERLGPKYAELFHGVVTGAVTTPQQILEAIDRGDVTWAGGQKAFQAFNAKDKPDQAAIHQRIDFANQQIKNAALKGTDEAGITGEKPTPKMYEKLTGALQALNTEILAAGGDLDKIAKLTSHEAVQDLIERVYPMYERNADRVLGGAKAFAAIPVPNTIAPDERSQTAYRDIAGIPPTMTTADGKSVVVSPAKWAQGIDILRRTGQVDNFNKTFGVDTGAYILKTLPYKEPPVTPTPVSLTVPAAPEPQPELARVTPGAGTETPAFVREAAGRLGKWISERQLVGRLQPLQTPRGAVDMSDILAALRDLERGVPAPGVTP